jgi:hypothetical protein
MRQASTIRRASASVIRIELDQDGLCARDFFGSTLEHDKNSSALILIGDNGVFRNAVTVERRTQRAEAADNESAFDPSNERGCEISKPHDMPNDRNEYDYAAEEPIPKAAPESADSLAIFHTSLD